MREALATSGRPRRARAARAAGPRSGAGTERPSLAPRVQPQTQRAGGLGGVCGEGEQASAFQPPRLCGFLSLSFFARSVYLLAATWVVSFRVGRTRLQQLGLGRVGFGRGGSASARLRVGLGKELLLEEGRGRWRSWRRGGVSGLPPVVLLLLLSASTPGSFLSWHFHSPLLLACEALCSVQRCRGVFPGSALHIHSCFFFFFSLQLSLRFFDRVMFWLHVVFLSANGTFSHSSCPL